MSKEPEWEAYDPQMAWDWHDWAEERIAELKAQNEILTVTHGKTLDVRKQMNKRIEKLEAENRIFRATESVDDTVWDALLEQIRSHQSRIEKLEAENERLREERLAFATEAEELRALMGDNE